MNKILVTGADGYIGKRLSAYFRTTGLKIIPLYHAERANITEKQWHLDLTRLDHLALLKAKAVVPETVIHLAGYAEIALQSNPEDPCALPVTASADIGRIYQANVGATANLLDFCLRKGVRHLVLASSQAVYGFPQAQIVTEESPCVPLEHYAASKWFCEQILKFGTQQGLSVTVLRFPGVFSEQRKSGAVFKFCHEAVNSNKIRVTIDFPLPFDVIHLEDVVEGIARAVHHGGQGWKCLNLSYGEPCSLDLLADAIAELVPGCEVEHSKVPQPVIQLDPQRAIAILQWKPQSRQTRLAKMVENVRHAL
jgi:UDP-glucose 4-epimerase